MIQSVDDTLYHLFKNGLTSLGAPIAPEQIRFQPPDADWRGHLTHINPKSALNVYLVELRENRKLRSNERVRDYDAAGHVVSERPAPARVDCHYLITAWSGASEDGTDPDIASHGGTSLEHAILHEVASLLGASQPLEPARVWGGSFPVGFSTDIAVATLPTVILPGDGFPKYGEFWGTMGATQPWKPAVYLVVTVPLATTPRFPGPPVTAVIGEYRPGFEPAGSETLVDLGGHVLDAAGSAVDGAWVQVENAAGDLLQTASTDERGRFVFRRLRPQHYVLRAGASGVGAGSRAIDVPVATGEYDLHLT